MLSNKTKGYLLGILAAASYGTNPLFALPLYDRGMTPDSVLFWRYLAAIPVLAIMIIARGRSFKVGKTQVAVLFVLGLLVAFSSLALFMSYKFMDVGVASTLLFVYPIMVAVIMAVLFKEKVSMMTVVSIAVALTGIGLLFEGGGSGNDGDPLLGTLLVMGSALSYAIYIVAVNKTSLARVATLTVTFYVLLFGVSLFAIRLFLHGGVEMPGSDQWYLWGCVLGLAILPTAISFACTTGAVQYIGSTPTAILGALEPVTAVVIGVAVFGEHLTGRIVLGLILIVLAVTLVVAGPKVSKSLTHIRKLFPRLKRK